MPNLILCQGGGVNEYKVLLETHTIATWHRLLRKIAGYLARKQVLNTEESSVNSSSNTRILNAFAKIGVDVKKLLNPLSDEADFEPCICIKQCFLDVEIYVELEEALTRKS